MSTMSGCEKKGRQLLKIFHDVHGVAAVAAAREVFNSREKMAARGGVSNP